MKRVTNIILYTFIAILPYRYALWITDTVNAEKLLGGMLFLCLAVMWLRRELEVPPAFAIFIAAAVWLRLATSTLAALRGPYGLNLKEIFGSAQFMILFAFVACLVRNQKDLERIFKVYLFAGIVACGVYLTEYYFSSQLMQAMHVASNLPLRQAGLYRQATTLYFGPFHTRSSLDDMSLVGDTIHFSFLLLALLPINCYLLERNIRNRQTVAAAFSAGSLLLIVTCILLSYSRAATAIMVLLGLLVVAFKRPKITVARLIKCLVFATAVVAILAYVGATDRLLFRLTEFDAIVKLQPELEPSAQMRSNIYHSEARLIERYPILGIGFFNFVKCGWRYSGLRPRDQTGESLILQILAEGGWTFGVGLLAIIAWLLRALPPRKDLNPALSAYRVVLLESILAMFLMSFTIWTELEYHVFIFAGLLLSSALRDFGNVSARLSLRERSG